MVSRRGRVLHHAGAGGRPLRRAGERGRAGRRLDCLCHPRGGGADRRHHRHRERRTVRRVGISRRVQRGTAPPRSAGREPLPGEQRAESHLTRGLEPVPHAGALDKDRRPGRGVAGVGPSYRGPRRIRRGRESDPQREKVDFDRRRECVGARSLRVGRVHRRAREGVNKRRLYPDER
ncbi:MAG: hypothetical protein DBX59_01885 [Bacillota bacterium]|nr:MAG: hypothetical protein DBX59_01885 [Bacillota bacterium]